MQENRLLPKQTYFLANSERRCKRIKYLTHFMLVPAFIKAGDRIPFKLSKDFCRLAVVSFFYIYIFFLIFIFNICTDI